jgi:hypothetical protein
MPKITFVTNNLVKQANYLCFLAKNLSLGRYQNHGFVVLSQTNGRVDTVVFPDLVYPLIFWRALQKTSLDDYGQNYPPAAAIIRPQLATLDSAVFLAAWAKAKKDWLSFWTRQAGRQLWSQIKIIEVLLTSFGTRGSFNFSQNAIACTARLDLPVSELGRTVLLALCALKTNNRARTGELGWYQRQAVGDYLMPTPISPAPELYRLSASYLFKLGFPVKTNFPQNRFLCSLTRQERALFSLLQQRNGELVSFDQAAEAVWHDKTDAKFSLAALAKIVENLRRKVLQQGINYQVLFTKRGQGYYWLH